jgi:hypothetical protein
MTRSIPIFLTTAILTAALILPLDAQAIPAFSRQIHADCRTCHFQSMPALNAYGRAFKMNGFRETKEMRQQRLQLQKQHREKQADKPGTATR